MSTADVGDTSCGTGTPSLIVTVAHILKSATAPGSEHEGAKDAQGAPSVSETLGALCVKYCPPVAPVSPNTALGAPNARAKLIAPLRLKASPAPDRVDTLATHAHAS